jgi:hypothetical protein
MQQQRKEEELRRMPRRSARRVRQATRTTARFCDYISAPSTEVSILGLSLFGGDGVALFLDRSRESSGPPTFITGPAAANLEAIEPSDDASLKSTAIRSRSQPFGKMRLTLVPLCDCDGWLACDQKPAISRRAGCPSRPDPMHEPRCLPDLQVVAGQQSMSLPKRLGVINAFDDMRGTKHLALPANTVNAILSHWTRPSDCAKNARCNRYRSVVYPTKETASSQCSHEPAKAAHVAGARTV